MIRRKSLPSLLVAPFVAALLLTGCADTPDVPEPESEASAVPPAPTEDALEVDDSEGSLEPEPQEEPEPSAQECVEGVWKSDNQVFADVVKSMGPGPGDFAVEGDLVLNFTGSGDYFEIKDAFTLLVSAQGQTIRNVTTGSTTGSYTVEDDLIHFFDSIDVFHETHHEIPGIGKVDMATGGSPEVTLYDIHATVPQGVVYDVYDGAATYECSADELRLTVDGGTSVWHPSDMPELEGWKP